MNTLTIPQTITSKELAHVLFTLLTNLPDDVDMAIIASAFNQVMQYNELRFKPYFRLLAEADDKYLITPFDTTEDFFYDAINSKVMYQDKVEYLINLTINF
ncbi:MAG: hypothetical protein JWR05_3499 [Mucilaginibacter sp.]|nr:hypothetical protein [Mucilaginibacter sp.]